MTVRLMTVRLVTVRLVTVRLMTDELKNGRLAVMTADERAVFDETGAATRLAIDELRTFLRTPARD